MDNPGKRFEIQWGYRSWICFITSKAVDNVVVFTLHRGEKKNTRTDKQWQYRADDRWLKTGQISSSPSLKTQWPAENHHCILLSMQYWINQINASGWTMFALRFGGTFMKKCNYNTHQDQSDVYGLKELWLTLPDTAELCVPPPPPYTHTFQVVVLLVDRSRLKKGKAIFSFARKRGKFMFGYLTKRSTSEAFSAPHFRTTFAARGSKRGYFSCIKSLQRRLMTPRGTSACVVAAQCIVNKNLCSCVVDRHNSSYLVHARDAAARPKWAIQILLMWMQN